MRCTMTVAGPSEPHPCASADRLGGRAVRRGLLIAWAALVLMAAGCGPSRLTLLANEGAFNAQVLKADRPVVVEFSKGGCVWCMFMDSRMDALMAEYQDRVVFARFELVDFWHRVTSDTLWRRYRIAYYPTVILFVDGKERKRWVVDYSPENYRNVLEEVAAPVVQGRAAPPAGLPSAKP
ncbi:MAG: hypothetical protein IMZ66_03225 [Planctomycetes bacterium]|nr:hypothetical protein [Planctomycetota bacterium]